MNHKLLVKISNIIGIVSIILLVYWVFVFISITVFGLRVFRENITETFYLSIVGILALMLGSVMINIMLNLTRIAEKNNQDKIAISKKRNKNLAFLIIISFPLIFGLLYIGDYLTSKKKENILIESAKSIIENNKNKSLKLLNYSFTEEWIIETENILALYSQTDKHFPYVSVIVSDSIEGAEVFLGFRYYFLEKDKKPPKKKDYIQKTTKEERDYLHNIFYKNVDEIRFSSSNGNYELFYPYHKEGKIIVLYFSDYQRYGKIGS